jgi:hypothetical protein
MKKYFVLALAFAMITFVAPRAFAKGSLAIGHGEAYGWAVNMHSYDESDRDALRHCGEGCKIVYRFNGTCAAYAKDGPGGATGWAHGDTREEAERLAKKECRSVGGHECGIRVWGCDTD